MSYDTNKNFAYYHQGKVFHVYRITRSVARGIDTNGVTKEYGLTDTLYPDETITDGIRVEYTALHNPFVEEDRETSNSQISSNDISFSGNNFISEVDDDGNNMGNFGNFAIGDRIRVQGSTSNDGEYSLTGASATGLGKSDNFTAETKGQMITITQVPVGVSSPTELSHLNLNRMLSLACVDYLKAMIAERDGDLERKEYYMRNFSKKVSDNESNKNKIYIAQSTSYAVK
jgi:hypothetical protein|tara:strand:- start:2172 stop:2861 length:690 start_codon:yes stop_codon:yes gene_type:complete